MADTFTKEAYFKGKEDGRKELVYHPAHYTHSGRKECWEEMREIFGDEAVAIFDVLSAYKYLYRAGTKDDNPAEQDRAKIDNYLKHCKQLIQQNRFIDMFDAEMVLQKYIEAERLGAYGK